ncbi:cutinase-domain-containing protein [Trichodelitschia bisporula]|uniref:Cutinase-domain-containing protein n=1 Tax=Trichodelitschia bisporula TaxID=703511 RepID=A0A6G1HTQ5_9PEZI|nr:cutinase-domain-containing protein [Trichodelitschia bisporula]
MLQRRAWVLLLAALKPIFARPQPAPAPQAPAPACSPLELVIARGTTEPLNPSYGLVVGDPLFDAVKALIPDVTGYKVDYPASFAIESRDLGAADVVKHLATQLAKCPQQKYVLVGYSQGGDLMHTAAVKLDPAVKPKIVALVMFGDPGNKGPNALSPLNCDKVPVFPADLAAKLKENCEKGDPVCTNDGTDSASHLVYSDPAKGYIAASAAYIQKQFTSNGKAGASPSPNVGTGDNTQALLELGEVLGAGKNGGPGCAAMLNATGTGGAKGTGSSSTATTSASATAKTLSVYTGAAARRALSAYARDDPAWWGRAAWYVAQVVGVAGVAAMSCANLIFAGLLDLNAMT